MRLTGSIAGAAFDEALALVRAADAGPPERRPPFDYTPIAYEARPEPGQSPGVGPLLTAAADLAANRRTCVELVEAAFDAIDTHDATLMAVVAVDRADALAQARALDAELARGGRRGPLHGIPITVKDVIDAEPMPTRAGSDAFERLAPNDACAVARLRRAGAVIVAKVSTHEFALGVTSPQSRNPHDATRIPGGSSGGSAISVATGMGLASLGTDTRASIRVPAALSGVVGFKPTYGSVPTDGVVPLSWTMDHVALMAVTVADAAAVLDALFGPDSALASVMPRAGVRVAVAEAGFEGADPLVADVIDEALRSLAKAGAALVAAGRPNPSDLALANAAGLVISRSEAAAYHRALGSDQSRYWEEVAEQLSLAAEVPAVDYIHAQRLRAELADGLLAEFDHADVVAMPTAPVLAPPADDFAAYLMILARNAIPWSLVGFPAISVPCGKVGALPVGLQLVAPPGREDRLVAVGKALELALG